jgi:uncharacterized protein
MDMKDTFRIVRDFAKKLSDSEDIHGFPHVKRVFNLCIYIGTKLNANLTILKIAAFLHDIGRNIKKNDNLKENHAEISANLALSLLKSQDFDLSEQEIMNIIHCIKSHSFSNKKEPKTLEAQILSDADKLDAIGAIGLYRTIGFTIKNNGDLNNVIQHIEEKIINLKDMLLLDISKKIAEKRHKIILDFYNQIKFETDLE